MLKHSADRSRTVTADDTAAAWGEAFPPAASTPFVLGLAEVACHELVTDRLADGEITVGVAAEIEHLAPSAIGATLVASPRLTSESGRGLEFAVEVHDGETLVARVTHRRVLVERARIMARLGA
jgi:fluoroacetyl-CoA thioesterase